MCLNAFFCYRFYATFLRTIRYFLLQAGDVTYADVDHKGGGVVHFGNRDDMEYALRKLDGSEFSNRYDSAAIQVTSLRLLQFRDWT